MRSGKIGEMVFSSGPCATLERNRCLQLADQEARCTATEDFISGLSSARAGKCTLAARSGIKYPDAL